MKLEFHVASDSNPDELYTVAFYNEDGKVSIWCDCAAGDNGQVCKHKRDLAQGDDERLTEEDEIEALDTVVAWVRQSPIGAQMAAVQSAEAAAKEAQKATRNAKTELARLMRHGE